MIEKKVAVLATGGTIAGRAASAHDNVGYTAAQVGVAQMLALLPVPEGVTLVGEQVAQVDSKDMSFEVWTRLAQRCAHWLAQDVHGIVITHGTDTLEETAFFLSRVLRADKPVVLTCAMRPATSLQADGPQNVLDAIQVATSGGQGVVAVCAGTIHSAVDVAKVHTYRLDAFDSGDAGPLGYVEEGRARLTRAWPDAGNAAALDFADAKWPRVEIVMNHAGASGAIADALVGQGIDGLVVAATGNGTIHHDLEAALVRAREAGVAVVISTRCAQGRVIARADAAWRDSNGLSPVKARVALMLELLSSTKPAARAP